jgi:hypothetical protein
LYFLCSQGLCVIFPLKVRLWWAIPAPCPQVSPFSYILLLFSHFCDLNISNIKLLSHTSFRSATKTEPNVIVFSSRPGLGRQLLLFECSNPFGGPIKFPFVLLLGWYNQSVLQPGYHMQEGVLFRYRADKRKFNILQTHDRLWGPGSVGKWFKETNFKWNIPIVLNIS